MTLEDIYREYERLTLELCTQEDDNTLECAGAMMGQAMKLYKLALSPEDFDALMHIISQASNLDTVGWEDDTSSETIH
jgi:hypothetical protein